MTADQLVRHFGCLLYMERCDCFWATARQPLSNTYVPHDGDLSRAILCMVQGGSVSQLHASVLVCVCQLQP